jgi:polyprenyl-phospho-N-acetylgalactosaminyl synthase
LIWQNLVGLTQGFAHYISMRIFFIVPAFNESAVIANTLQLLLTTGYEIVLVDDCSQDSTAAIAAEYPIHLLRHPVNLGQGAALQTGMEYVKQLNGDIAIHFDADGQHRLQDLPNLLAPVLANTVDIALGSRFLNAEFAKSVPLSRKMLLKCAKIIDGVLTGLWLSDVHNGYRDRSQK